jgi:hypothetical protein
MTLGTLMQPFTQQFQPPTPSGQSSSLSWFEPPPTLKTPDPFSYADFVPPDRFQAPRPEDIVNDPGYRFRVGEGERGITNSAAAKGLLRTGGTLKDFMTYGQSMGSQEYDNVWNRRWNEHQGLYNERFGEWGAGHGKAADAYKTNWGVTRDAFEPVMEGWRTKQSAAQRQGETDFERAWRSHQFDWEKFKRSQEWPAELLLRVGDQGLRAAGM